jgi:endonuclease III
MALAVSSSADARKGTDARRSRKRIVEALLQRHGQTYAAELGIDLERNTPSALYRWLCTATLLSARIGANIAMQAARALAEEGWTTAQKMADATWEERTRVLNQAGYARYDESTSRMLGDTARMLLDKYGGDLRRLRDAAERDPARERALLKECKGIGDIGADIFCREVQIAWDELFPFADRRALDAANRLGLENDAARLARRVSRKDYPRLLAALVRTRLAHDFDEVLDAASR